MTNEVADRLPLKAIVPVVFVSVTVPALTLPLKLAPPELAIERLPLLVNPLPLIAPPVPAFRLRLLLPPVTEPIVRPAPAATVLFVAMVELPASVTAPRSMALPFDCTVPSTVVLDGLEPLPAVFTPPINVSTLPVALPRATVPVFRKLTAFVMEVVLPFSATL